MTITVLPLESLGKIERAHRLGYATVNFPQLPPQTPGRLAFGPLRLCGMEHFEPDYEGFHMHPHANVEVVTVLVRGAFSHRDSLGRGNRLKESGVQVMSAGAGLEHEEMTHGACTAIQLMFDPAERDTEPRVLQGEFERVPNRWVTLASGRPGAVRTALPIRQDVAVSRATGVDGTRLPVEVAAGRGAYLLVVRGEVVVGDHRAGGSERILIREAGRFAVELEGEAELLWIDVAL